MNRFMPDPDPPIREVKPWEDDFEDVPPPSNEDYEIPWETDLVHKVYEMPFDVSLVAILGYN
jgi:hypothetical protein